MTSFEPIAIVGQSCLLPGVSTPQELHQSVVEGRVLTTEGDPTLWGRGDFIADQSKYSPVDLPKDQSWHSFGGFIRNFESIFEPDLYPIEKGLLEQLDPVFQWVLHTGHQSLDGHDYRNQTTGVVLGNLSYPTPGFNRFAEQVWAETPRDADPKPTETHPLNRFMSGYPAALLAQTFGLTGPVYSIDAACASSLYAIKLACDELHQGRSDIMLAGGVNAIDDLFSFVGFTSLGALSRSGQSRPFHQDADGLLPASGAGFVTLKRLEDAEKSGDAILAVIRGIGLSNDGKAGGLLSPSGAGQVRAMKAAYDMSGISPDSVSLIECHATGTQIGDRTELQSLSELYRGCTDVPIGSLKSNVGHLVTAAGIAGVIKVVKAMAADVRPPSIGADVPLEQLEASPFRVLQQAEPWTLPKASLGAKRAAVSAFGFGGNNAHLLLEEHRPSNVGLSVPAGVVDQGPDPADCQFAIVGMGMQVADLSGVDAVAQAWFNQVSQLEPDESGREMARSTSIELDCLNCGCPPNDLELIHPQQLMAMAVCAEAKESVSSPLSELDAERISVLIGMGIDTSVARYCARINVRGDEAKESVGPALEGPRTLGCMPNLVANRISAAFNFKGPSYTVNSEELSGVDALDIAKRDLANRQIDAALVGAVDLSCEPAHHAATVGCLPEHKQITGDAGVCIVVKRLEDAQAAGDIIIGILGDGPERSETEIPSRTKKVTEIDDDLVVPIFGHAHAASGLLQIALSALCLNYRALPTEYGPVPFGLGCEKADQNKIQTTVESFTGRRITTQITGTNDHVEEAQLVVNGRENPLIKASYLFCFEADQKSELIELLEAKTSMEGRAEQLTDGRPKPVRLAIVANNDKEFERKKDQAIALLRRDEPVKNYCWLPGVYFSEGPLGGKIASTFPTSAAAYSGMARHLLLAFPNVLEAFFDQVGDIQSVQKATSWIYEEPKSPQDIELFEKLRGGIFISQTHSTIMRDVLKIESDGYVGFSAGEIAAFFASGVWDNLGYYYLQVAMKGVWTEHLGGDKKVLEKAWDSADLDDGPSGDRWTSWGIQAPLEQIEKAVSTEKLVYVTTINTSTSASISGSREGCERVVQLVGAERCQRLYYDIVFHVPEAEPYKAAWRKVSSDKVVAEADRRAVPFYGAINNGQPYMPTEETVQESMWRSASSPNDFRAIVNAAYDDGVRVFVEHGAGSSCTSSTQQILGEREHLAVSIDGVGQDAMKQLVCAAAQLYVVGVEFEHSVFAKQPEPTAVEGRSVLKHVPAHSEVPKLSIDPADQPLPTTLQTNPTEDTSMQKMTPAPKLRLPSLTKAPTELQDTSEPPDIQPPTRAERSPTPSTEPAPKLDGDRREPTGPTFTREQLHAHATGKISGLFGETLSPQDSYEVQVRMPAGRLLLADRVVGLDAEVGVLGEGTIWTETDIGSTSWYLNQGHIPPGVMIEAGQADLFLISYMGIDLTNKGQRAYRLLGCKITYMGELPRVGDTIRYQIHVDRHAAVGDTRLFFFHFDAYVGDRLVMRMRDGTAGFFTPPELQDAKGLGWTPESVSLDTAGAVDAAVAQCVKTELSNDEVQAFSEGRLETCFGENFSFANTHTRTPTIPQGDQLLIDEVTELNISGGPWGRGYLKAERKISPDDWFFDGHFKNDPCMPGTLMTDMAFQGASIFIASLGFTLNKDGWTFRPVSDEEVNLRCRAQVTPSSSLLVLEIFVREIVNGEYPTLRADILCTVDGVQSLHGEALSLCLKPDYPNPLRRSLTVGEQQALSTDVASVGGVPCDEKQASDCAWGKPSETFGTKFTRFDDGSRLPRLPGAPYNFISRIRTIDGEYGGMNEGTKLVSEWDVPDDCIFLSPDQTLPFAILLEAALQPCGWLACYLGCPLEYDEELLFRNLDGTIDLYDDVFPPGSTVRCEVTSTGISNSGGVIIVSFEVAAVIEHEGSTQKLLDLTSVFGYFSEEALSVQKGLPTTNAEKEQLRQPSAYDLELLDRPDRFFGEDPHLSDGEILMLDRVTGYWPEQGEASLGVIRGEKKVQSDDWFLKAHFFRDPVQPGSLGLESMLQLLKCYAVENNLAEGIENPRFESLATNKPMTWRYRGQIVPKNICVETIVEIVEVIDDDQGRYVTGNASLWCDGLKIYQASNIGLRILGSPSHEPDADAVPANGLVFGTEELEQHALASLGHVYQIEPEIRLPQRPFLLVDRVEDIRFEPSPQGKLLPFGTAEWTTTEEDWYDDDGQISPVVLFEPPGQVCILLSSLYNANVDQPLRTDQHDARCFRAISLDGIKYFEEIPEAGATLRYTVAGTNVISSNGTTLFYMKYECWHEETLLASVDNVIVGLVPRNELQNAAKPKTTVDYQPDVSSVGPFEPPAVVAIQSTFTELEIAAFAGGDGLVCFGPGFEQLRKQNNPPKFPADKKSRYIDEILDFAAAGGPHSRGYLKAKKSISPSEWFFKAHFENDPCMPAALIALGCYQSLSFYLAACGATLNKDNFSFTPVTDQSFEYKGKGQVTPDTKEVYYEVYIETLTLGDEPEAQARIVVSADDHLVATMTLGVRVALSAAAEADLLDDLHNEIMLPQFDSQADLRAKHLERRRREFEYDFDVIPEVPFVKELPEDAKAGDGWNYKVVNKLYQIRQNWERTIDQHGYVFEEPLPETAILDLMQMLREGDLLSYIEFTNPELGVAVENKRPQSFEEYYGHFARLSVPEASGPDALDDNEAFADYFVAGLNPLLIENCRRLRDNYGLSNEHLTNSPLFGAETLESISADGRLFVVDYAELATLKAGVHPDQPKYIYSPIVYLAIPQGGENLELLAIQVEQAADALMITPQSQKWDLRTAKTIAKIADITHHEPISHLALSHLVIEPLVLASYRQLSAKHPLHVLLIPHFEGTLPINALAIRRLLAEDGRVEQLLGIEIEECHNLIREVRNKYRFRASFPLTDLERRGVGHDSKLTHYPYRDDGLLLWAALEDWCQNYIDIYYESDGDVADDTELASWVEEICSPSYGRIQDFVPDGKIVTKAILVETLTMIIYTCSAHHSAINYPQGDATAVPYQPLAGYQPPPKKTGLTELDATAFLPPLDRALKQTSVLEILGRVYYTQLGKYADGWFGDDRAQVELKKFQEKLLEIEDEINRRNSNRRIRYQHLLPSKVTQSINI